MTRIDLIKAEIIFMRAIDQKIILLIGEKYSNIIKYHTEKLKAIVSQYGCIKISQFGAFASHCAWLIVQHSDHDIDFQEHYLHLMKEVLNDVLKRDYAYLADRVRIHKGRKQIFGTQFDPKTITSNYQPYPIEDIKNLDKRRREWGLEPFYEYTTKLKKRYNLL